MIKLYESGVYVVNQKTIILDNHEASAKIKNLTGKEISKINSKKGTIAHGIISSHNTSEDEQMLRLDFDIMAGHDVNAVSIMQSSRASGLQRFNKPYIITNCHNALCAVGGTINEDDHKYLLSVIKKYGGVFVPPSLAIIHQYMREVWASPGKMILASDSHTRYGPLGTMAIGEGGGEIVKQILGKTYDIEKPKVIGVYLTGTPVDGVGPHDISIAFIGEVFKNGFVKDSILEFIGDGVNNLSIDYRLGIDTMTTETACWSSVWKTDDMVKEYLTIHGRENDFKYLEPLDIVYYDKFITVDLSKIKPMIALPFHPSNAFRIEDVQKNTTDILNIVQKEGQQFFRQKDIKFNLLNKIKAGKFIVDQAIIGSCAGGLFENITDAADILSGKDIGVGAFNLSVYTASQPIYLELLKNGSLQKLIEAGAIIKPSICGPCFGAGDIPANGELSIRNTTRNFSNREGSISSQGQLSSVALMDARSIAATAINGGVLTAATQINIQYSKPKYYFNSSIYKKRIYDGINKPKGKTNISFGPNIKDWPEFHELNQSLILKVVSVFEEDVITTDDLLPSDASNFRSNPEKLAEHTLSMKDPTYVSSAKEVRQMETDRRRGITSKEIITALEKAQKHFEDLKMIDLKNVSIGSTIYANNLGDGSSREQSASNQKVLGAWANIAREYATKRYASNVKNWGMIPFIAEKKIKA